MARRWACCVANVDDAGLAEPGCGEAGNDHDARLPIAGVGVAVSAGEGATSWALRMESVRECRRDGAEPRRVTMGADMGVTGSMTTEGETEMPTMADALATACASDALRECRRPAVVGITTLAPVRELDRLCACWDVRRDGVGGLTIGGEMIELATDAVEPALVDPDARFCRARYDLSCARRQRARSGALVRTFCRAERSDDSRADASMAPGECKEGCGGPTGRRAAVEAAAFR